MPKSQHISPEPRIDRRLTNRLAERMNVRWTANYPDAPEEFLAYSLQLFREVYYRAQLWRMHEPEAELREEPVALDRILRQVEFELGTKPRRRPASVVQLLLDDLRASIWHRPPLQRMKVRTRPPAPGEPIQVGEVARTGEPL